MISAYPHRGEPGGLLDHGDAATAVCGDWVQSLDSSCPRVALNPVVPIVVILASVPAMLLSGFTLSIGNHLYQQNACCSPPGV